MIALLLIIGVIAFIMTRKPKDTAELEASNQNDISIAAAPAPSPNYGQLNVRPASNQYDESFLKSASAIQQYGGVPREQTQYDDPSVLSLEQEDLES